MAAASPRGASPRMGRPGWSASAGTRSRARSFFGSNQMASASSGGPSPPSCDGGVVLARHHVGVRDHHPVPREPAAALHPEPAGGAQQLHHAGSRTATSGSRAIALGRSTPGSDPRSAGTGRIARARGSRPTAAGGRSARRGSPSAGSARAGRARQGSGGPPPRRSRPGRGPAPPPEPPRRSRRARPGAGRAGRAAEAEHLERRRQDAADQQRAQQREHRGVGELEPSSSSGGPRREPITAPPANPASEGRRRSALQEAPHGHQGREGDNDPIEGVTRRRWSVAPGSSSLG